MTVARLPVDAPIIDAELTFRYSNSRRFKHRFFDNFPNGTKIPALSSAVDLAKPITVEDVRAAIIRGATYIAVRFTNPSDGRQLWTNYSRNGHIWMLPNE